MIHEIIVDLEKVNDRIAAAGAVEESAQIRKMVAEGWLKLEAVIVYLQDLERLKKKYREITKNEDIRAGENFAVGHAAGMDPG